MMKNVSNEKNENAFTRFINILLGRDMGPVQKELRSMNRRLDSLGYKYYSFSSKKVKKTFAAFLYEVYATIAPLREFFLANNDNEFYKKMLIQYSLTDDQKFALEYLQPERIMQDVMSISVKTVAETCQKNFAIFKDDFSTGSSVIINDTYENVLLLKQLCILDYYSCIKQFCPIMVENDFTTKWRFRNVAKNYVADFIVDFLNAASMIANVENWKYVFEFISSIPGWKAFDMERFHRMTALFSAMSEKKVFQNLACLMRDNPSFILRLPNEPRDIVRAFMEDVYQRFKITLQDIVRERKMSRFNELLSSVFRYDELKPLKFYSPEASRPYEVRGAVGFNSCNTAMYLNSFFEKYLKGNIVNLMDIFKVGARSYSPSFVAETSTKFQDLVDSKNDLLEFDQHLNSNFSEGYRLKSLLDNSHSDDKIIFKLNAAIGDINMQVTEIISSALDTINDLSEIFNKMLDDKANNGNLVSNWKELEQRMQKPVLEIVQTFATALKNFSLLMKNADMVQP